MTGSASNSPIDLLSESNGHLQELLLRKAMGGVSPLRDDQDDEHNEHDDEHNNDNDNDDDKDDKDNDNDNNNREEVTAMRGLTLRLESLAEEFRAYREAKERELSGLREDLNVVMARHERTQAASRTVIERQRERIRELESSQDTPRIDNRSPRKKLLPPTRKLLLPTKKKLVPTKKKTTVTTTTTTTTTESFHEEDEENENDDDDDDDDRCFGERSEDTFDWEGLKGRPNGPIVVTKQRPDEKSLVSLQLEDLMSDRSLLSTATKDEKQQQLLLRGAAARNQNHDGGGDVADFHVKSICPALSTRQRNWPSSALSSSSRRYAKSDSASTLDTLATNVTNVTNTTTATPPTLERQKRQYRLAV